MLPRILFLLNKLPCNVRILCYTALYRYACGDPGVVYAQEFLRALSVEGRSAYQEWRGEGSEGGSCHGEEPNLACKAAMNSLENPASVDWLEIAPCATNQSLFSGEAPTLSFPFPCNNDRFEELRITHLKLNAHIVSAYAAG